MAAESGRPDPPPPDDIRAALDDAAAALAAYKTAGGRCTAAAEVCGAAANKFMAAARAYVAAFTDLETAVVRFKAAVECAADAPAVHAKPLCGFALDFSRTTINAHKAIVEVSGAADVALDAYNAKHEAFLTEVTAVESKKGIASSKMAALDAKLRKARRVLPKRKIAALDAEVASTAHHDGKIRVAVAEQFVAAKAADLVEKRCSGMAAMRDTVADDIDDALDRMDGVIKKHVGRGR